MTDSVASSRPASQDWVVWSLPGPRRLIFEGRMVHKYEQRDFWLNKHFLNILLGLLLLFKGDWLTAITPGRTISFATPPQRSIPPPLLSISLALPTSLPFHPPFLSQLPLFSYLSFSSFIPPPPSHFFCVLHVAAVSFPSFSLFISPCPWASLRRPIFLQTHDKVMRPC